MSLLPLKTHITASQPVFAPYTVTGGGGGTNPTFSTVTLGSSLVINNPDTPQQTGEISLATNLPAAAVYPPYAGNQANVIGMTSPSGNCSMTLAATDVGNVAWIKGVANQVSTLLIDCGGGIQMAAPLGVSTLSVSSINGSAPAITTHSQQDVGALFEALFAANPSLSTIVF